MSAVCRPLLALGETALFFQLLELALLHAGLLAPSSFTRFAGSILLHLSLGQASPWVPLGAIIQPTMGSTC